MANGSFGGGTGTELDPYIVEDALDLNEVRNDATSYFLQNQDISLSYYSNWTPIEELSGKYDGGGYNITNLVINSPTLGDQGLFEYINGGELCNINIIDASVSAYDYSGILASYVYLGKVDTCTSSGTVTTVDRESGGLVEYLDGSEMVDCSSSATVTTTYGAAGGLCGYVTESTITNSYATGDVSGQWYVGGLCGWGDSTFVNCYATGNINGEYDIGGFLGFITEGNISGCYSTGEVSCDYYSGGFIGELRDVVISECYSTGNVTIGYYDVGNAMAYNGGFLGTADDCTISKCYSTGNIEGDEVIGGFCGEVEATTVTDCYCTGNVDASVTVGYDYGTASGFICDVTTDYYDVGSVVTDCYCTGEVTKGDGVHSTASAFADYLEEGSSIVNSFYNSDTAGQTDDYTTPKTTAEMGLESTYIDWDFDEVWVIGDEGYPELIVFVPLPTSIWTVVDGVATIWTEIDKTITTWEVQ